MPLLQRRELLQRQRVDLAELGQLPLGGLGPLLLLRPDVGHGRRPPWATGTASGPYSAISGSASTPNSSSARCSELLEAQPLLGAGDLAAVRPG